MSNQPSGSKTHSKRLNSSRDRDKSKFLTSADSGGSSQCDTPPLNDKDGSNHGKYAGISPESIQCMAEQFGVDITSEATLNLAEDASYKLRQVINTIALHSEMMKKSRLDYKDVNMVLRLMDTSPVIGCSTTNFCMFGDEKLCFQPEYLINISECAVMHQSYEYTITPTISVEWITDEKSLAINSNISACLHNYYTKVSRAILSLKKKLKDVAVDDLATNTRIGPIFPNLFNLAVLVLNNDNLDALNVQAKGPLQSNVLDMVDALCSNPCSMDTNIQQQFQRLFPVMVSNILSNGSMAEKMVAILTKITRTWPSFITIGKGILFDYLSQATKERLDAPMIKCVIALGRQALVECLGDHLNYIDDVIYTSKISQRHTDLRQCLLDASTSLLRSEPTNFLEDYVTTDYTLYEMLGDSIMPRRLLFPIPVVKKEQKSDSKNTSVDEDVSFPIRSILRRPKLIVLPRKQTEKKCVHRESVFELPENSSGKSKCIKFKVTGFRNVFPKLDRVSMAKAINTFSYSQTRTNSVIVVSGQLNRFRYRLNTSKTYPLFGVYLI